MEKGSAEIVFIINRSGSIAEDENYILKGFSGFIDKQREIYDSVRVTTVLFDDKYDLLYNAVSAEEVSLGEKGYFIRESTAMLDAIGNTIIDMEQRLSSKNKKECPGKVIFVIITDRLEDSGKDFTREKINDLIRNMQSEHKWEFVFWGSNLF